MSATTDLPALDLREQIVRIDRAIAETQKFQAETAKLRRDRFLAPALALAATLGAIATFAPAIIRAIGGLG